MQPVSAMSDVGTKVLGRVMVEAEGPSGGKVVGIEVRTIGLHLTSETLGLGTGCLMMLGSPRPQLAPGGVVSTGAGGSLGVATAAAAKTRGLKIAFSLFRRRMVLLPPNMLLKVAAGL